MDKNKPLYKVYIKELGGKVCLCSQPFEDKEQFKIICKNLDYEIYLDNKNISNKYRPKVKKEIQEND